MYCYSAMRRRPCPRRAQRLKPMLKSPSRWAASAPLILLLAACAVGPNYQPPDMKVAERFDSLDTPLYSTDEDSRLFAVERQNFRPSAVERQNFQPFAVERRTLAQFW